ncbi:hypothetical protein BDW75DRAFT_235420 [Aspergillus navahoensis]
MPQHSPAQTSFQCKYPGCSATYRRKEHLNRHMARHNRHEHFSCPHCDSTLVRRNDLLRRHVRKYHPERELAPSRARKACRACHARKERCDGGDPCDRCLRRKIFCSYTHPEIPRDQITSQEQQPLSMTNLAGSACGTSRWIAQEYIDIYFLYFHPTWPFLHRGTLDISKEPCVLLQSMVMIGLWIKGEQATRDMAMTFHRKLLSEIQAQRCQWYISESVPYGNNDIPWPMATYQSILLQLIFAVLIAKQETTPDLNLRCQLPATKYELLTSLVQTCRRLGLFSYPNMLSQHDDSAPITLIWLSVEEVKRFGLALYKLCRLCTRGNPADSTGRPSGGLKSELLTLADLDFCMPDSDEVWNALSGTGADFIKNTTALQETSRDNRDPDNWISRASGKLCDAGVGLDWI